MAEKAVDEGLHAAWRGAQSAAAAMQQTHALLVAANGILDATIADEVTRLPPQSIAAARQRLYAGDREPAECMTSTGHYVQQQASRTEPGLLAPAVAAALPKSPAYARYRNPVGPKSPTYERYRHPVPPPTASVTPHFPAQEALRSAGAHSPAAADALLTRPRVYGSGEVLRGRDADARRRLFEQHRGCDPVPSTERKPLPSMPLLPPTLSSSCTWQRESAARGTAESPSSLILRRLREGAYTCDAHLTDSLLGTAQAWEDGRLSLPAGNGARRWDARDRTTSVAVSQAGDTQETVHHAQLRLKLDLLEAQNGRA